MSELTREEQYLANIAGMQGTLPEYPVTREEQYLAKAAGESVEVPDYPMTRKEQYLAKIAEGGGGDKNIIYIPKSEATDMGIAYVSSYDNKAKAGGNNHLYRFAMPELDASHSWLIALEADGTATNPCYVLFSDDAALTASGVSKSLNGNKLATSTLTSEQIEKAYAYFGVASSVAADAPVIASVTGIYFFRLYD